MPMSIQASAKEFYYINGFRLFQAAIYLLLTFTPFSPAQTTASDKSIALTLTLAYLLAAIILLIDYLHNQQKFLNICAGITCDILAALAISLSIPEARIGVLLILSVDLAVASVLLSKRLALFFAALASLSGLISEVLANAHNQTSAYGLQTLALLGIAYFAIALLCSGLSKRLYATEDLAREQQQEVANLEVINELIIRHISTGILLIDKHFHIRQFNRSASLILGKSVIDQRQLNQLSDSLAARLKQWQLGDKSEPSSMQASPDGVSFIPRFSNISLHQNHYTLIFLDDISHMARHAEQLTLASIGHLSASIAHEIRNPLAAIQQASELLLESTYLSVDKRYLIDTIYQHGQRMNRTIESVLQLSRQQHSHPEPVDLCLWARTLYSQYQAGSPTQSQFIHVSIPSQPIETIADPQQLQQVVWNLLENAQRYGHLPGTPAHVRLVIRTSTQNLRPIIEIIDRGEGIPKANIEQLFKPFFTTHKHGTGLGLYLAKQMCEANLGQLEYVPVSGGGSCFRITLSPYIRDNQHIPLDHQKMCSIHTSGPTSMNEHDPITIPSGSTQYQIM